MPRCFADAGGNLILQVAIHPADYPSSELLSYLGISRERRGRRTGRPHSYREDQRAVSVSGERATPAECSAGRGSIRFGIGTIAFSLSSLERRTGQLFTSGISRRENTDPCPTLFDN